MENKSKNNYRTWLEEQMKNGTSIEDIFDALTNEANAIEKERNNRYSKYDKSLLDGEGDFFCANICDYQIALNDMATILAHFMCQNVPGFSKFCAAGDIDPVEIMKDHLKAQIAITKAMVDNADKSSDEQIDSMFNAAFGEIGKILAGALDDDKPKTAVSAKIDSGFDPVREFLTNHGL